MNNIIGKLPLPATKAEVEAKADRTYVDQGNAKASWVKRALNRGEDLNTLVTPGLYWSNTWAVANELVNRPPAELGAVDRATMEVTATTAENISQRWRGIAPGNAGVNFVRYRTPEGTWSVWSPEGALYRGAGSPEGKIPAPVGAAYSDIAATTGAVTWVKTTGTGSTGWRVSYGDTGWRNVTALLIPDVAGTLYIARNGSEVTLAGSNLRPPSTGVMGIIDLPSGFRPSRSTVGAGDEAGVLRPVFAFNYSPFRVEIRAIAAAQSWANFTISFMTHDPWPTTLPGTPA